MPKKSLNIKNIFKPLIRLLTPSSGPIAGLEIADSHIRFFEAKKGKIFASGLRLPPGVIQNGKVADGAKFSQALKYLRKELGFGDKEKISLIAALPSQATYLQLFNLPYLTNDKLKEAAELNLQMISPVAFDSAFSDWEFLSENGDGQISLIGAFSEKENIETIAKACAENNFMLVAIEPSVSSLARAVQESGGQDLSEPQVIMYASDAGLDFVLAKNNRAYFNYFVSWKSVYGDSKEISGEHFSEAVDGYVRKVLTFSQNQDKREIKKVILVAGSSLAENLKSIIEKNFKLPVLPVSFNERGQFGPEWGIAMGAFRRGLIPRSDDSLLSLTGLGTAEEFSRSQILAFVLLWRKVIIAFAVFLVVAFAGVYSFLSSINSDLEKTPLPVIKAEDQKDFSELRASAQEFNKTVASVILARNSSIFVEPYFEKLRSLASGVNLIHINFQSFSSPVSISGDGPSQDAVLSFKKSIEADPMFSNAELPLSSIVVAPQGRASFSMTVSFNPSNSR